MKYWIKMTRCSKFYHASLISSIPSCILVHNTTAERVALKSSYLTLVGAKPFPANQNAIHDCFGCVIQIFRIFSADRCTSKYTQSTCAIPRPHFNNMDSL